VISSTTSEISVEYERDGSLKKASELAKAEYQRYGLHTEFDSVAPAISEKSNVAKYRCVKGAVAAERESPLKRAGGHAGADRPRRHPGGSPLRAWRDSLSPALKSGVRDFSSAGFGTWPESRGGSRWLRAPAGGSGARALSS
jgi:hypothetical protein